MLDFVTVVLHKIHQLMVGESVALFYLGGLFSIVFSFFLPVFSEEKLIEGQVIELEDGSTAFIQQVNLPRGEVGGEIASGKFKWHIASGKFKWK